MQDSLDDEARVFFDPNSLSEDGTIALSSWKFSEDGSTCAYGLSVSGSDWNTIHFINAKTGVKYDDCLEEVRYSNIAWTHDNLGIFYSRYPEAKGKTKGSETFTNVNHKVYYHRVGTSQDEDVLVVEFLEEPLWRNRVSVSDCGNWLIVMPAKECTNNLIYTCDLREVKEIKGKLPITMIVGEFEADYDYVGNNGNLAIFQTNKDAPNFRLIAIDLTNPQANKGEWLVIVKEHESDVLDWTSVVDGNKLALCYMRDVKNSLQIHCINTGETLQKLPLDVGTIIGFSGDKKYSELFYQFASFLTPGIIYRYDLAQDKEPRVFREIKVANFDFTAYCVKQVFYPSKDGTKIPMFIVQRKNARLDGSMPALIYGYGGFNISLQPSFSVSRLIFVQHLNGVMAIPNVRGGGEYGEKWHNAGRLLNKQNTFDDFQAAAEYLIDNGYTSAKKITIQGGSNGGLTVMACANQRPELFGAVVSQCGLSDMLRFHKFTIGQAWISDYGSSDDPKYSGKLIAYSPLHNVPEALDEKVQYPATILLSSDHDDRVVPLHALKLVATLQHNLGKLPQQTNPLIARIETKAGHGAGKPTTKIVITFFFV